eukprot:11812959-Alexandrium_andersonii.AAC.1
MAAASTSALASSHLRATARKPPQLLAAPTPPQSCAQDTPTTGLRGQIGSQKLCAKPLLVETSPHSGQ